MKEYTNPLANKICGILSPLVGDMMACGVLKSQAIKIGFTEENITIDHIPALAEGIERGLVIFLGSGVAKQIGEKIRDIK